MSLLQDFVTQTEGKCLDLDHAFGCQCVDLADEWANRLGHPLPLVPAAKDFAGMSVGGWTWIGNTPDNAPQAGDLVIWGTGIGPFGHVAVCIGPADTNTFTSLDQNWFNSSASGSPAARVTHNFTGVVGWLRPDSLGGPINVSTPTAPFDIITNSGHWFDHPNGVQQGAFNADMHLHVVEVVHDASNGWNWYRPDIGAWWLVGSAPSGDADARIVVPAPSPAPVPAPPAPDDDSTLATKADVAALLAKLSSLEARAVSLENFVNKLKAALA